MPDLLFEPPPVAQDSDSPEIVWRPTRRISSEPPAPVYGAPRHRLVRRPDRAVHRRRGLVLGCGGAGPGTGVVPALYAGAGSVATGSSGRAGSWAGATTTSTTPWTSRPAAAPAAPAIIWEGEDGAVRTLTYAELARRGQPGGERAARRWASGKGDRVGIFMPMLPEDGRRHRWPSPRSARSSCPSSPATAAPPWPPGWPTASARC